MSIRHGAIFTARSLKRGTRRAFSSAPASSLPRTRPNTRRESEGKESDADTSLKPATTWKPPKAELQAFGHAGAPPLPIPSLLEQQARLEQSLKRRVSYAKGKEATQDKALIQSSKEHYDLKSFLAFAGDKQLNADTAVYKGTHYEYTVMESLKQLGFRLERTGRSNDKGIDLLGHWNLPGKPYEIKVLVQCKVSRGTPSTIRELEGAYAGAPSEWQGDNVLALLATSHRLTKGVVEGVQRSRSSLGGLHIESDGLIRQFLWNAVAGKRGLEGVGVTAKYQDAQSRCETAPEGVKQTIKTVALTWKGQPFIPKMNAN